MGQSPPTLVEPAVLRWARTTIGLSAVAAARKIGVPDARVDEWESGVAQPTVAQLRKAATVYKRPLGVFFLAEPPTGFDVMRDFRRSDGEVAGEWSPELHGEYRRALTQRGYALELAEIEEAPPPTRWDVDALPDDAERIGAVARASLVQGRSPSRPAEAGTPYDHLNYWVAAVEDAGVLVLSSAGGGVPTSEMRAFSLYFDVLPVVVLNGSDAPRGRLFSLLHECAHLLLHTAGLCDTVTDERAVSPNRVLEARCNAIAAAVLMPADEVEARLDAVGRSVERWDYASLREAAAPFGVSAEAFLRRLVTMGRVDRAFYNARREEFLAAYETEAARARAGGGNWYRNTARDLGKGYVRRVADAYHLRVIDSYTAASYLNVKVGQIARLAEEAEVRAPA